MVCVFCVRVYMRVHLCVPVLMCLCMFIWYCTNNSFRGWRTCTHQQHFLKAHDLIHRWLLKSLCLFLAFFFKCDQTLEKSFGSLQEYMFQCSNNFSYVKMCRKKVWAKLYLLNIKCYWIQVVCSVFTEIITTRFVEMHLLFTSIYKEIILIKTYGNWHIHFPSPPLQTFAWTKSSWHNVHAYNTHVLNWVINSTGRKVGVAWGCTWRQLHLGVSLYS